MNEVMRLRTLAEINAHYAKLLKLAHGNGVALVRKQHVRAVAHLLDNEAGQAKVRQLQEKLRRA